MAEADLSKAGVPKALRETVRSLARAVCEGRIKFEEVVESESCLARLAAIPGIGNSTAQYIAMRALGEPDALPASDPLLSSSLGVNTSGELESRAKAWRPWRSYATMYLWTAANSKAIDRVKKIS